MIIPYFPIFTLWTKDEMKKVNTKCAESVTHTSPGQNDGLYRQFIRTGAHGKKHLAEGNSGKRHSLPGHEHRILQIGEKSHTNGNNGCKQAYPDYLPSHSPDKNGFRLFKNIQILTGNHISFIAFSYFCYKFLFCFAHKKLMI